MSRPHGNDEIRAWRWWGSMFYPGFNPSGLERVVTFAPLDPKVLRIEEHFHVDAGVIRVERRTIRRGSVACIAVLI